MFSGAQTFIFAFLILPFSQTSALLILRHHRQTLFSDYYLKLCVTMSTTTVGTAIPANSSGRQGHILNLRPSFQTSLFYMRVISKSKTCGFVAEGSAVKLMVPANLSLKCLSNTTHTHTPLYFLKCQVLPPNPPSLLLPALAVFKKEAQVHYRPFIQF